jgi:hypothetical protein
VKSFREYDTYWLSGYVKAFQLHGDGEPLLFYYEDGGVRGINVVMKRDIAKDPHFQGKIKADTYFDFSTPYGYGGWIVEGEPTDGLFDAYEAWCREHAIVSEFVRYHPVLRNHIAAASRYDVIPLGYTVAMDLADPEVIWTNITSKNRNMIRKAQKNGVTIRHGRDPELFESFRSIYNSTMDKDHAQAYYYFDAPFYQSIHDDLAEHAEIFYAVWEDRIIAASIMLYANGFMNYHLSGSVREYASLAPTNLLLYEAALWGCGQGLQSLYLGGGVGSGEDSLFKFKRSFYRPDDLPRFHIGKKILNQAVYHELVAAREELGDSGFFPKYRA